MFYTIYKTTNKINQKIYIGKHQTKDVNDDYLGSGKYLLHAIERYGIENFEKEILFVFDCEDEMNAKEAELVTEEFVKEDTNYNLCPGGKGGWGYNNSSGNNNIGWKHNHTDNSHQIKGGLATINNAAAQINRIEAVKRAHRDGKYIYDGMKGKSHSVKTKKSMSKAHEGQKNSQFGKSWIWHEIFGNKKVKKELIPNYIDQGWIKTYKPGYKIPLIRH